MPITNRAITHIVQSLTGAATIPFDSSNTYIGVGNGDVPFNSAHTELQGTEQARFPMDVGYPIIEGDAMTYRATFNTSDGNFAWEEWGVFNAPVGGTMLNRVVEKNGVKLAGQTWIFEVTLKLETT